MPPKDNRKVTKTENDFAEEDQQINDEIVRAKLRLAALEAVHADRLEEIAMLKRSRDDLLSTFEKCEGDANAATEDRLDILTDFTRQYKNDEKFKIEIATRMDATLNRLAEEKLKLVEELKKTKTEFEEAIAQVKAECETLYSRIADMEREFDTIMMETKSGDSTQ
ncbi:hypothetical protein, conserved [Trypanosoma brucei gambiense DAL972]|uniref:Dynein regulatory complex protein 12 n=3 Tax=Trypanosoma brucei TaxID=5691 RepID=Q57YJ7_TRYB2|nr:hypothetical protein, conserved [Trypanosoma brucei gambiense DAL972]XP_847426.1 hypothetical protein, conserved [Trypanosoma brucei brucei TREU927]AAX69302.1 hypothetical protein, conserved [Trypanosoma brucei]RHW72912.1 hypothetical protein DPX39_040058200 [Trypanosoma brucei equiperdum]AAZ13360.1 hypothetical protein, conserved [Trypanosoma brucei brucei TREU927]CBH13658.1 hypothetical protein, conserved [Trypanosoma brucei gambiense DAL972]|eukprot:XP_011775934.1 hypothetical protein, conserved [Trypanosoma brucei gambiense DAL972]